MSQILHEVLDEVVAAPDTLTVQMPESVAGELARELISDMPDPHAEPDEALVASRSIVGRFQPKEVLRTMMRFSNDPACAGAMVIKGFVLDDLIPDTPNDGGPVAGKQTFCSEGILLGYAQQLGAVAGYSGERDGRLVHDVAPSWAGRNSKTSEGAVVPLGVHNEIAAAAHRHRPGFICLLCVRPDHDRVAVTPTADVAAALRYLSEIQIALLRERLFATYAPASFGDSSVRVVHPIITGPAWSPEICFNSDRTSAITADAGAALEALADAFTKPDVLRSTKLEPGDLMIINNYKAVHGRSPFSPRFDGCDRWLQRTYVFPSLWEARDALHDARPLLWVWSND